MNWILFGFKAAGKTYFAKKLGLPFIDTDALIEEQEELSPYEIVQKKGERYFRQIEKKVISSLNPQNHIISVGGGAVLDPGNLAKLRSLGPLIYLDCPKATLERRIFSSVSTIRKNFEKLYCTRIPEYEKIASYQLLLEGKTDNHVLEELWQVINSATSSASQLGVSPTVGPLEL